MHSVTRRRCKKKFPAGSLCHSLAAALVDTRIASDARDQSNATTLVRNEETARNALIVSLSMKGGCPRSGHLMLIG